MGPEARAHRTTQSSDRSHLAGRGTSQTPLRGRDEVLGTLRSALSEVAGGGSCGVLLRGRPGIGKTRLLAEALAWADTHHWHTLTVAVDIDSPSAPLTALMDSATTSIPPFLTGEAAGATSADPQAAYRLTRALSEALQARSLDAPTLVVIDDLQWLDGASITVVKNLMRALEGERVAWLAASREERFRPALSPLVDWIRDRGFVHTLRAIDADAAVQIAGDLLGGRPGPVLASSMELTECVPLHVVEMVRGLREESLLKRDGNVVEAVGGQVPARFGAASRSRVLQLSPAALRLIQVGSLVGRRFRLRDVLRVTDERPMSAAAWVEELISAEIVTDDGEQLSFVHDTLREAAEQSLSPSLRKAVARDLARVRLEAGEQPSAVAASLIGAAEPGDVQSFDLLLDAALQLAASDSAEAARVAAAAFTVARDVPRFAARAARLLPVMWAGGLAHQAQEAAAAVLPYLSRPERAEALLAVARQQTESSFADAIATAEAALSLTGVSQSTRTELLAVKALNAANKADAHALRDALTQARSSADPSTDHLALATIDATESVFVFNQGRWERAVTLINDATRRAERAGMRTELWMPEGLWAAFMRNSTGACASALTTVDAGLLAASRARNLPAQAYWQMARSRVLYDLGRLGEARLQSETVLDLAEELGLGDFANATAGIVLAKLALRTGDPALTQRVRPLVAALAEGNAVKLAGSWTQALGAFDEGRAGDAYAFCAPSRKVLGQPIPPMTTPVDLDDDLTMMQILRAAGDQKAMAVVVETAVRRGRMNPASSYAAAISAAVQAIAGEDAEMMSAAAKTLSKLDRPLVAAHACELAEHLDPTNPGTLAHLEDALRMYESCGATRDASRVLLRLRARGVHRRPASGAKADILSAREAQVFALLVGGSTTQQIADVLFMSPHTVISHTRRIYAKTGVNSRSALRQLAGEQTQA